MALNHHAAGGENKGDSDRPKVRVEREPKSHNLMETRFYAKSK